MVSCLACGGTDLVLWARARDVEYHTTPEAFSYHRCQACHALSIADAPLDQLHRIYPSNYYSFAETRPGFVQRVKDRLDRRWFRAVTAAIPGTRLAALDVGGGTGQQLETLRAADPRFVRTVVVDLDDAAESRAVARGHEYVRARIEHADVSGPFDLVLLLNLIEHVADPAAVLRKVRTLLSPNGVVLVKTPNYDSLDARLFRHRNWGGYHCPRHWVLFTQPSFAQLAQGAGLRVRSWSYTQGAPFWAVSVLALLETHRLAHVSAARPAWQHALYAPLSAFFAAVDFARRPLAPLSQMTFALETA